MNSNVSKSVISGVAGTAVMTAIMFIAPMMGMPKMNPAEMLSSMSGMPVAAGWAMHFMIGIVFAAAYVYLFAAKVKIGNRLLKGAAFGMAVFIFAQVMMGIMGAIMGGMPQPEGSMVLMMIGSVMGHVIHGVVVVAIVKE